MAASCTALPPSGSTPPAADIIQVRRSALRAIEHWDVRGRVGLRLPDNGAHASIHWRRGSDGEQLDLAGPFGGGRARLQFDESGARLRDASGREYAGADPEQLLYQVTGWHVPLAGLGYWIRGLPMPDIAAVEQMDDRGRLRALKQLGWDIEFLAYQTVGEHDLPSKLHLTRQLAEYEAHTSPRIEVRLAVSSWDISR